MRGQAEFVKVIRVADGAEMTIVKWVAEKYPERFTPVVEKPKTKRKPKTKSTKED